MSLLKAQKAFYFIFIPYKTLLSEVSRQRGWVIDFFFKSQSFIFIHVDLLIKQTLTRQHLLFVNFLFQSKSVGHFIYLGT